MEEQKQFVSKAIHNSLYKIISRNILTSEKIFLITLNSFRHKHIFKFNYFIFLAQPHF